MADSYLALLQARRDEIQAALPKYLDADRFISNARTIANIPDLRDCSPQSMYSCALDAARRGLEIGGPNKHCGVVRFKQTAVLLVQWQGKAFLWFKSGAIKKLKADVVYVWDQFEYVSGDDERIDHRPDLDGDHSPRELNDMKNIRGAYAIATLWSGEPVRVYINRNQLVRVMESVKKKNNGALGFGWSDWLPEMCRKTAVHRLDGFIQPPPEMTPEQLDAWQRAGTVSEAFETEATPVTSVADHLDNPEPLTPEVMQPVDEPIGDDSDEYRDIIAAAKSLSIKSSALCNLCEAEFGVDSPEELKHSQVAKFSDRMLSIKGKAA